jgi:hypothetical protein
MWYMTVEWLVLQARWGPLQTIKYFDTKFRGRVGRP